MGKKNSRNQPEKLRGADGFEKYYSELFGERWPTLRESLFGETVYAELSCGGAEKYFLDPASVFATSCIPLSGAETILDLCAAPGGKTLVLASRMEKDAVLVSNERSVQRKQRLVQVCDTCLPEQVRGRIKISCSDGAKWCTTQTEVYDRILLDAPCSSERHVLSDEKYLAEWSPNRIKTLAMEQWALLSSAWRLLKKGGYLLYSTCALCPAENDAVIARLFKKFDDAELCFRDSAPVLPDSENLSFCTFPVVPVPEATEFGFHILPDQKEKCGPIWFSLVHKKD
ncbi:MAG: RsmB/NOP family class I SAM-dependent RNA methyltransferase [Treponema sp.]|nr:RsmB/NOP family class I SAM-dependent RNA methyltransferase [Treponema sp.]